MRTWAEMKALRAEQDRVWREMRTQRKLNALQAFLTIIRARAKDGEVLAHEDIEGIAFEVGLR